MTESTRSPNRFLHLKRVAFRLVAAWTAVMALGGAWHFHEMSEATLKLARIQASLSFQKDLVYRRWSAAHGGVYVPVTEETPANPYLSHLENRDVSTTSGLELTLVNPAYMTRQVHELGRKQYGHQGHITSLNPLRPENAPDPWEAEALRKFERGETEVVEFTSIGDTEYLRLMRPMITEVSCLKCHAAQGYKEGDVRGGISLAVPMAPLWTVTYSHMASVAIGYCLLWLLGLGGIGLGASRFGRRIREGDQVEKAMQEAREQSMRNRVLVETAGAAAHEINQPLSVIAGLSQMFASDKGIANVTVADMDEVRKAAKEIDGIVKRMEEVSEYAAKPYVSGVSIADFGAAETREASTEPLPDGGASS
jgi:hypothetical protein